jgi:hypothetical protein
MDVLIKIRGQVAMDLGSVNAPPPLELVLIVKPTRAVILAAVESFKK